MFFFIKLGEPEPKAQTMMAKFTMWEILRLDFVSHESKCSPEQF